MNLNERLAERRAKQLDEMDELTQRQLREHESGLRRLLSDVQRTTESAIQSQSERLNKALNDVEERRGRQIENIEARLAKAADQAERLSQIGGLRSWARPVAITVAVMLTVGAVTAGGLLTADRLIDSKVARLEALNTEIERAQAMPRLPQGVEVRTLNDGQTYLTGIDPETAWVGTLNDDTPVIRLTNPED